MTRYLRKQIIIILIFLLIVTIISAGAYFLFRPKPEATCFDGIRNQGELEIDCGGPCLPCEKKRDPLEVIYQNIVPTTENNYDLVMEIKNPNSDWGVKTVRYSLDVFDQEGKGIFSKQGSFYILPQENKYVVEQKIYLEQKPEEVEIKIIGTSWEKLSGFRDLTLRIRDKKIQLGEELLSKVSGVVVNNTNYNLSRVELVGVIFDENKEIIAAGRTEVTKLLINENRYFEINWPQSIDQENVSYEIKAYTDVFSPENFIEAEAGRVPR